MEHFYRFQVQCPTGILACHSRYLYDITVRSIISCNSQSFMKPFPSHPNAPGLEPHISISNGSQPIQGHSLARLAIFVCHLPLIWTDHTDR
ncbi:hypothetical protein K443DRAFT_281161 [Laccaria amethystina LaAM-08-1]|uniref:Uncharacterized protein n=1 Tax=Laccaria amethystina LaAM-08-1 TaxID=1095629 RepID=A0A0C9XK88_9AGAR|nr:hypothetical protein K443DRAFT_281161 [Laccaria amethystina LaAM-08-1]